MARVLPWWPHILFGMLEPLACIAGSHLALTSPAEFFVRQVPDAVAPSDASSGAAISSAAEIIVLQVGNIYWLLAALAVLVCFFSGSRTVRGYLLIIAVADLGHVWAVYQGLSHGSGGAAQFWDWRGWNDMVWGNVGVSVFLCINRVTTLLGLWGPFVGEEEKVKGE